MKNKYLSIFFLSVILSGSPLSQENTLNPNSMKVVEAYKLLQINPSDSIAQRTYIHSFPQEWSTFLNVFQPKDFSQLYRSNDQYLDVIDSLQQLFPQQVGELLINLGVDGEWQADATGQIQRALIRYASENPSLFSKLLEKKSKRDKKHLITFMADMEGISSYQDYQDIIDHLGEIKQKKLAKEFEAARKLRMQQDH